MKGGPTDSAQVESHQRQGQRIIDVQAIRSAKLIFDECAACGAPATNIHHVVSKGSPHFGDDVRQNFVGICGSGTTGCHGAFHGSPYVVEVYLWDGDPLDSSVLQRRDAEWVGKQIGVYIDQERPDVIEYVLRRLGDGPGREFLRRFYFMEVM